MPKINYSKNHMYSPSKINKGDYIIVNNFEYPIMARLQNPEIPQTNLIITKKSMGTDSDITEDSLDKYITADYNIFSGSAIKTNDKKLTKYIYGIMSELNDVLIEFMKAGYHLYKENEDEKVYNKNRISDWIINFEYPILKMFKLYYGIETSCEDIMFVDEFLDNPQFRHMITLIMMKLIVNFVNNNDLKGIVNTDYYDVNYYETVKEVLN